MLFNMKTSAVRGGAGKFGKAMLAAVLAVTLSLPTPSLAWATSRGLSAADLGSIEAVGVRDVNASVWDGSVDVSWYIGNETDESYTISTPAQLAGLAALVNGTTDVNGGTPLTFRGKTVTLGDDIWLNAVAATGYDSSKTQRSWTPIGDLELSGVEASSDGGTMPHYKDGRYFDGTFDGAGHVIRNLYIYDATEGTYGGVKALFGNVGGHALITNVGIEGGWVMGRVAAALVAISHVEPEDDGDGNKTYSFPHIIGCYNTANVTGNGSTTRGTAGIFAGEEQYRGADEESGQRENYHGGAFIANCYNMGTISKYTSSSPSTGGIAGTGSIEIYGCYNAGLVDVSSSYAGSIAGVLVAPGYNVGQNSKIGFSGTSAVRDCYAKEGNIPADSYGLQKLYNMIDAKHGKGDSGKANPAVLAGDRIGFQKASWFLDESAWRDLSQSYTYVEGKVPQLYWQTGQAQWSLSDDKYKMAAIEGQQYTGSPIEPAVALKYNAGSILAPDWVELHEGSDYTVAYSNNIEAASANSENPPTAAITGVGRFTGGKSQSFAIFASSLKNVEIAPIKAQWWYGSADTVKPEVTVTYNGAVLEEGRDYTATVTVPKAASAFAQATDSQTGALLTAGDVKSAAGSVKIEPVDEAKFSGSQTVEFRVLEASTGLSSDTDGNFEIGSKADLQYLAWASSTKEGSEQWVGKSFKLTDDIDATSADDSYLNDRPVDPLFTYYATNYDRTTFYGGFSGTFDGNGHAITLGQTEEGLSLDEEAPLALFAYTKTGGTSTFENLTTKGSLQGDYSPAAGLLVMAQTGEITIESCVNEADIYSGLGYFGSASGFVCESSNGSATRSTDLTIRNCTNKGELVAANRAAGFVGAVGAGRDGSTTFENCTNEGRVYGKTGGAAGIAAYVMGGDKVGAYAGTVAFTRCSNSGAIETDAADAGGIMGWNQYPMGSMSFTRCGNTGAVTYGGAGCNGAGIAGRAYSPASFLNCFNNAAVTAKSSANRPAGILGYAGVRTDAHYADITFRNVYSTGSFGLRESEAGALVGIVWLHNRLVFENCYFDSAAANKAIGYNFADDWPSAIDPPIVEGEAVEVDAELMKTVTFASMLGGAFTAGVDAAGEAVTNDGFPYLAAGDMTVHDLSKKGSDGEPLFKIVGVDDVASNGFDYTGAAVRLDTLAVQDSADEKLKENVDYVVFYTTETTAGAVKGRAIVEGIGSYQGSLEYTFDINPCKLSACRISAVKTLDYADFAGSGATQEVKVTNPVGSIMASGTDYEVTYANNTAPGFAYLRVEGKAPFYTGSVMRLFKITAGDLSALEVQGLEAHYPLTNGSGGFYPYEQLFAPNGYRLQRTDSYSESAEDKHDYIRVFYKMDEATGAWKPLLNANGSNANHIETGGTYKMELRGNGYDSSRDADWNNGHWTGVTSAEFTYGYRIASDDDLSVSGVNDVYAQTGEDITSQVKPRLVNKATDYDLTEGVDYKLSFKVKEPGATSFEDTDSVEDPGDYKLVVTGKGGWFGTREVPFEVVPAAFCLSESTQVAGINTSYFHTGSAVKPVPTKVQVMWDMGDGPEPFDLDESEYKVYYEDADGTTVDAPTEVGSYFAVIAGAGEYRGSKRVAFSIERPALKVYVRTGTGAAKLAKQYTMGQFTALKYAKSEKEPVSALYNGMGGGSWSVASSNSYVRVADLLKDAGVKWASGVSMTYANTAGSSPMSSTVTYAQAQSGMFYPYTTRDGEDSYDGEKVPFVLSITDKSSGIDAHDDPLAQDTRDYNLDNQSSENAPRALLGVQESDYKNGKADNMMGRRLVSHVDTVTVTLPAKANTLKASAKAVTAKAGKSVAAAKAFNVKNAQGKVTYRKTGGSKNIAVSGNGTVAVRSAARKTTYTVKVNVTAAGNKSYAPATKSVTLKVTVK